MPAPKSFLFVNKTVKSKSLSNNRTGGVPYTQINRQAQLVAKSRGKITRRRKENERRTSRTSDISDTASPTSSGPRTPPKSAEAICLVKDDENDDEDIIDFGSPIATVDSVCSSVISLDRNKQHVLEYYTTVWMPSKDHVPPGCQITGLTPVRPHDGEIAYSVVQEAFQSHDEVSMYALLTAGSRRMQVLHNQSLPRRELPDVYNVQAIHALRKRIERGEPPSERLILDMSFLILAELFTPAKIRSELYWNMIRSLIIQCGGLQQLTTYTAQIAMAFDHQISGGTLTRPALDPFAYPELIGIRSEPDLLQRESQQEVMIMLRFLDPRLRLIALELHALTEVIDHIRELPPRAVEGLLDCVRGKIRQLYGIVNEPLRRVENRHTSKDNANVIIADSMYLHIRVSTWRTWLWYAALKFLPFSSEGQTHYATPTAITTEMPRIWRSMQRIEQLLQGTGWMTRLDILLWIAAMGLFVATSVVDRDEYSSILRVTGSKIGIKGPQEIKKVLANHFPLDLVRPDAYNELWETMRDNSWK